jgi:hypothetical protein
MPNKYLTELDREYATCERTKAVLRIHCGDQSPHIISDMLNLKPSHVVEVGVPGRTSSHGLAPIGRVNLWLLDSEEHVNSRDLRHHLNWLLDQVEPATSGILKLRQGGLVMDISCVWWSKTGDGGPALWPSQMRRIAALDLELSIAPSFYGDDSEPDSAM